VNRVVLDAALRSKVNDWTRQLEICDEAGQVLGRFIPTTDPSLYDRSEPTISREEMDRRKRSTGPTYTTAEVLDHLERL
jgi:hypothetical protein